MADNRGQRDGDKGPTSKVKDESRQGYRESSLDHVQYEHGHAHAPTSGAPRVDRSGIPVAERANIHMRNPSNPPHRERQRSKQDSDRHRSDREVDLLQRTTPPRRASSDRPPCEQRSGFVWAWCFTLSRNSAGVKQTSPLCGCSVSVALTPSFRLDPGFQHPVEELAVETVSTQDWIWLGSSPALSTLSAAKLAHS